MRRTAVISVTIGALLLGACGDDDDGGDGGETSSEEQPYADAIAAQFRSGDESEIQLTADQAECVAPKWVDVIGLERFEERDVTPEDISDESEDELPELGLDEDQGNGLYDAFEDCDVDVPAMFAQSFSAGSDVSEEVVSCLEDALDADLIRRLMVAAITQGDQAFDEGSELEDDLMSSIQECAPAAD